MIELLFILGFSLHNIEEAIWLPQWSKSAKKYHKEVTKNEFCFAVIFVTAIGYLITVQYFIFSTQYIISKYIFFGFVLVMIINTIFPHLVLSIIQKKYSPGTATGLLLNFPIGIYLLVKNLTNTFDIIYTTIAMLIISVIALFLINILFKIGKSLYD